MQILLLTWILTWNFLKFQENETFITEPKLPAHSQCDISIQIYELLTCKSNQSLKLHQKKKNLFQFLISQNSFIGFVSM